MKVGRGTRRYFQFSDFVNKPFHVPGLPLTTASVVVECWSCLSFPLDSLLTQICFQNQVTDTVHTTCRYTISLLHLGLIWMCVYEEWYTAPTHHHTGAGMYTSDYRAWKCCGCFCYCGFASGGLGGWTPRNLLVVLLDRVSTYGIAGLRGEIPRCIRVSAIDFAIAKSTLKGVRKYFHKFNLWILSHLPFGWVRTGRCLGVASRVNG